MARQKAMVALAKLALVEDADAIQAVTSHLASTVKIDCARDPLNNAVSILSGNGNGI